jgi:preprotein translocase subunit YajC
MHDLTYLVAMAAPAGDQPRSVIGGLVPFVLIFVVFYFLLIAPARKKQKAHQDMLGELKAGDKIITNGGIHGTVVGVTDAVVQVRIADQVKIEISKSAIAAMQSTTEN